MGEPQPGGAAQLPQLTPAAAAPGMGAGRRDPRNHGIRVQVSEERGDYR